jgi:sulfate permease, SulP family
VSRVPARPASWLSSLPALQGLLPVRRSSAPRDVLAGVTLSALAIPQALGYAKIAGLPVVTGLYTLLLPMAAFALLGSSRHLVVAADSATAAILAAALAGQAALGSALYVHLASLVALLTGGLLLLAWLARLGFLANFLSRTVLTGFLAGVGIRVAAQQLPDMLGVASVGGRAVPGLQHDLAAFAHVHLADVAVAAAVIVVVLAARRITRLIPGPLIAVVGAIILSRSADLAGHGVAVIGSLPRGLPPLGLPAVGVHKATRLLGTAASIFVVVLAQSAATSRAYAARHKEMVDPDRDLVGLGAANVAAGFSGTFVVNGGPTQTQLVDSVGGRSQLSQLTASAAVVLVLLFATGPLASLPVAALAAVVLVFGLGLVDVGGLRHVLSARRTEFVIAVLAAVAVVVLGVEDGIVLAVVASIIDHLRHTYRPRNSILVKSAAGHWHPVPVRPGARTEKALVVYRFGTDLYYANASRLAEDVRAITSEGGPLRWFVLDSAAIGDVDYTAGSVLSQVIKLLHERDVRFIVTSMLVPVRRQLDRYGIRGPNGPDAFYETPGEALEAFRAAC